MGTKVTKTVLGVSRQAIGYLIDTDSNESQSDSNYVESDSNGLEEITAKSVLELPISEDVELDVRIEFFPKRGKRGQVWVYYQFAAKTKKTGKRGGQKYRVYGGKWDDFKDKSRKEEYFKNKDKKHQRISRRQAEDANALGNSADKSQDASGTDSNT